MYRPKCCLSSEPNRTALTRRRRTALYVSCPCLVIVPISGKSCPVSVYCLDYVRFFLSDVCLDSVRCPDSVQNSVKSCPMFVCPDFFCLDSVRIFEKKSSGRTKTKLRCLDFQCSCPPTPGPGDVTLTLIISRICYRSSTDDCKNIWTCFGLFG